jgi:P-type Ca2+ transporter type 2C
MERLATGLDGLDAAEAARRLHTYGANAQGNGQRHSRLAILGRQFANLPTALLLGSSGASALVREVVDAAAIQAVVLLNAAIGYRIESKNLAWWGFRTFMTVEAPAVRENGASSVAAEALVDG